MLHRFLNALHFNWESYYVRKIPQNPPTSLFASKWDQFCALHYIANLVMNSEDLFHKVEISISDDRNPWRIESVK